jgi:branched-chain amino acid aminotransferase
MWVYLNGAFVREESAVVSVMDHSFLYGDGCFEGIGVFSGRIIHLGEHVDRFYRSARMLRIPVPVPPDQLADLIVETARRNGMGGSVGTGYLRPILSRGAGPLGVGWSTRIEKPTLAIIPQVGQRTIEYGEEIPVLTTVISPVTKPDPASIEPRIKTNNYLNSILAFLDAADRGADAAILRDQRGFICEAHGMNIMAIARNRIATPPEGVALAGITRANVLRAASELGIEWTETNLTPYDLICADEVLLTSSLDGVSAVSTIDGRALPGPVPGVITRRLRDAYVKRALFDGVPVGPAEGRGNDDH